MDAPSLLVVFDSVYLIAMAAWVGSLLFFSFGVAPIIFQVLSAEAAARFVRALFPRYYAWGATSGAVALAAFTCGVLTHPEFRGFLALIQITFLLAGVLVMLYCGNSLTPAINAARDAGPEQAGRFDRLHRLSVRLNALVLLSGIGLLIAFAARPEPTTLGILEPTPNERARLWNPAPNSQAMDRLRLSRVNRIWRVKLLRPLDPMIGDPTCDGRPDGGWSDFVPFS